MAAQSVCKVEGCGKHVHGHGWCGMHYVRWRRYGDPNTQVKISNGEAHRFYREVVLTYEGDECLIWPYGRFQSGYGQINGSGPKTVSRRLCEDANGPPPTPKHDAAHSCGHGHIGCVAKRHLSWKTRAENMADKIGHGTLLRGEAIGNSKLTEADIREIRAMKGTKFQREIAAQFGVSREMVGQIHRGNRWAWLQ